MATNPAQVGATSKPNGRSAAFASILRSMPPSVDTETLRSKLVGSSTWFKSAKDVQNAITYAQTKGLLSKRGPNNQMKNFESGRDGAPVPAESKAIVAPRSTAAARSAAIARRTEDEDDAEPGMPPLEIALRNLRNTARLADAATVDPAITKEELIGWVLTTTSAFRQAGAFRALDDQE